MKIGVTGGSGFIGTWIRKELSQRGHEFVSLDHRANNANGHGGG